MSVFSLFSYYKVEDLKVFMDVKSHELANWQYDKDSWKKIIPSTCKNFFDGCSSCKRESPGVISCLKENCAVYERPFCQDYLDDPIVTCAKDLDCEFSASCGCINVNSKCRINSVCNSFGTTACRCEKGVCGLDFRVKVDY